MEREANYIAVGAFVILVVALATVFVLWYSGAQTRREFQRYEIYFTSSVSGLTEGSTVRYLGVSVGRVASIDLDPRAADRVAVIVDLDQRTPVGANTLARLMPHGVTGLLFIDLAQGEPGPRNVGPEIAGQRYPVIRSAPSNLDLVLSDLPDVIATANTAIGRIAELLSPENVASLDALLGNLRAASETLPAATRNADALLVELRAATVEARRVAEGVNRLVEVAGPDVQATTAKLRESADKLTATIGRVDALLVRNEEDLDGFLGQGLNDLQQLIVETRDAAVEVRGLARSLRAEPSQLLYERVPTGVEIAR